MKITTRYHEDPYALHIGTEPPRAYYLPREDVVYSVHRNGCFGPDIIEF